MTTAGGDQNYLYERTRGAAFQSAFAKCPPKKFLFEKNGGRGPYDGLSAYGPSETSERPDF
jgi:hypothetical protein